MSRAGGAEASDEPWLLHLMPPRLFVNKLLKYPYRKLLSGCMCYNEYGSLCVGNRKLLSEDVTSCSGSSDTGVECVDIGNRDRWQSATVIRDGQPVGRRRQEETRWQIFSRP